jgi:hypothetical protein
VDQRRAGTGNAGNTQLVAIVPEMLVGHVKWVDGELRDQAMVPLAPDFDPKAHRATLDETDRSLWKPDDDDKPKVPWAEAALLPMIHPNTGAKYTYSTSSVGGVTCCKRLVGAYSAQLRAAPQTTTGHLPLVELGGRSYKHPDKKRGTIFSPTLEIVDWLNADEVRNADLGPEPKQAEMDLAPPPTKKTRPRRPQI